MQEDEMTEQVEVSYGFDGDDDLCSDHDMLGEEHVDEYLQEWIITNMAQRDADLKETQAVTALCYCLAAGVLCVAFTALVFCLKGLFL